MGGWRGLCHRGRGDLRGLPRAAPGIPRSLRSPPPYAEAKGAGCVWRRTFGLVVVGLDD